MQAELRRSIGFPVIPRHIKCRAPQTDMLKSGRGASLDTRVRIFFERHGKISENHGTAKVLPFGRTGLDWAFIDVDGVCLASHFMAADRLFKTSPCRCTTVETCALSIGAGPTHFGRVDAKYAEGSSSYSRRVAVDHAGGFGSLHCYRIRENVACDVLNKGVLIHANAEPHVPLSRARQQSDRFNCGIELLGATLGEGRECEFILNLPGPPKDISPSSTIPGSGSAQLQRSASRNLSACPEAVPSA